MRRMLTCVNVIGLACLLAACKPPDSEVPPPVEPTPTAPPQTSVPPPAKKIVLTSHLAGSWYPAGREELAGQINAFLEAVDQEKVENVRALILPHAGYRFSGQTAAYGLRQIRGAKCKRVIVMGPSHATAMRNVASIGDYTHYATPLGELPLDLEFIAKLRQSSYFQNIPQAHAREHSVQIELPLLQHVLGEFKLVPIVVGQLDLEVARGIGAVLSGLLDGETLVIASSDFTHYGPNYRYIPFRQDVEAGIRKLDMGACEPIREKDAAGFDAYCKRTGATICGRHPVTVLLSMLGPNAKAKLLHYDTSGRITGDFRNSVSYLSMAYSFAGDWPKGRAAAAPPRQAAFTQAERAQLLALARQTLEAAVARPKAKEPEIAPTPAMKADRGVFVTLNKHGALRGCIGNIYPVGSVHSGVRRNALNAAFEDPRFRPVGADELKDLHIEISVLTPPRRVAGHADIELGRHGIILSRAGRSAVFLPQVATEQGWNLEQTLTYLARKAGLPADAWREGAELKVFEAEVFGEEAE